MPKLDISPEIEKLEELMLQRKGLARIREEYSLRQQQGFDLTKTEQLEARKVEDTMQRNSSMLLSWLLNNYDQLHGWIVYLENLPDYDKDA